MGRYALNEHSGAYLREDLVTTESTNEYCKERRKNRENLVVTAKTQTGGRGTKGRSFLSKEGGVYLSRLTFYKDLAAKSAFLVLTNAAVAVCKTLEYYGVTPKIKWANDIHVNGKKICGILIENVFSGARIDSSVVGIGLNVHNKLDGELSNIATSLFEQTGKKIPVEEVTERLLAELSVGYSIDDYRAYLGYVGEEVCVHFGDERVHGRFLCVDDGGNLAIETENGTRRFSAAEVSLRKE